jgi:hypothetical protein
MKRTRVLALGSFLVLSALGAVILSSSRGIKADPKSSPRVSKGGTSLLGGPRGLVRSATEALLEGIMVQLISEKTSIRTTVFSNELGQFEFPKLETGSYMLRVPRPREFRPL